MRGGDKVHITSDNGTDLEFSITDRRILVDDGVISDEDIERGDVGNNLPCGEVFCAPVEDSANGKAYFDMAFHRGNKIKGIEATFKDSKMVEATAEENEKLFNEVIENSQGDKDNRQYAHSHRREQDVRGRERIHLTLGSGYAGAVF